MSFCPSDLITLPFLGNCGETRLARGKLLLTGPWGNLFLSPLFFLPLKGSPRPGRGLGRSACPLSLRLMVMGDFPSSQHEA